VARELSRLGKMTRRSKAFGPRCTKEWISRQLRIFNPYSNRTKTFELASDLCDTVANLSHFHLLELEPEEAYETNF